MPLVNPDERNPARWFPARVAWGLVRDGNHLRLCRARPGGTDFYNLTLDAWRSGAEPAPRFKQDIARGARVAVGLEPHRVLLRELRSPLTDPRKSAEIWPSLLDAALPFSLEECQVAFLEPRRDARGGLRCLAAAMRESDLREALAEWKELGIDPDLMLPESLLLLPNSASASSETEAWHWKGNSRSVFLASGPEGFLGTGGSLDPATCATALRRFLATWNLENAAEIASPRDVEQALAFACIHPHAHAANLRAGTLARPRMAERLYRARRTLRVSVFLVLVMLLGGPLLLLEQVKTSRRDILHRAGEQFKTFTGRASAAPGQEKLLAQRFIDSEWSPLREKALALAKPGITRHLANLLSLAQLQGVQLRRVRMDGAGAVELEIQAPESAVLAFIKRLRDSAWTCGEPVKESTDIWTLKAEVGS